MIDFIIPLAHGIGTRDDIPMPGWIFNWAAAIVLAVSFFALATLWKEPKLETPRVRWLVRFPRLLEPLCGLIGVVAFFALAYFGLAGNQEHVKLNPVPSVIFIFFWVGIPMLSLVFGDVFRPFNPWRAIGRAASAIRARGNPEGRSTPARLNYPDGLGRWPAVVGLIIFGWIELVSPPSIGQSANVLTWMMLAYMGFQLLGMSLFGTKVWLERGDAFGIYFTFFSKLSAFTVEQRRLGMRLPLAGLNEITPLKATVPFVATMIGITVFDGLSGSVSWSLIVGKNPTDFVNTIGFLFSICFVLGFYRLGILGMEGRNIRMSPRELGQMFAPSLIPIALGYLIAHYFSYLVIDGQQLPRLAAHPMGGASLAAYKQPIGSTEIWWIQVCSLLAGHVAGLMAAHDKAVAVWGKARAAAQSQTWMLVVMVGFTSLGLFLLSQDPFPQ